MRSLFPEGRWQRAALVACAVIAVAHQAWRWDWLIEDSAICFSYARNLVAGEGYVPFPGGERVEGTSDPTWMVLLTLLQALGLDGFTAAKPLAMGLTVATLPLLWRAARDAMPDDADETVALAAPFAYALSAQVAIWGASGLENPLWGLLLAAALVTTARDASSGAFLPSSTCWFLLTWTRPEGIAYAALGGAWWLLQLVRAGHAPIRPTLKWLAWFFVPTIALFALRWWYFAWPVANTFYAKVGVRPTYPFSWNARGWNQLREWAGRLWVGWYAPLYQLGLVGTQGRGAAVSWGWTAAIVLLLAWPGPEVIAELPFWPALPAPPPVFVQGRMALIVLAGCVYPFLALRRPGAPVSGLAWICAVFSMLFSVYADGDWMGAYRWMSLLAAPAAVLFAVGVREAARALELLVPDLTLARIGTALLLFGIVPPNLSQTRDHATHNRNETPSMVAYRVRFTKDLVRRTFFEGKVVNLEMDMGAHLWWAPEYVELDMAGLVDVPMSRHWYQDRAFVEEYFFVEHQPTFAHAHGFWADESGFITYDAWKRWMVEVGPYRDQKPLPLHPGVYATRALFTVPAWPHGDDRALPFAGGVQLHGVHVPAPVWPAGGDGFLEVGLSRAAPADLQVVAFLSRAGQLAAKALPIGYGEYPAGDWLPDDVYAGRHVFAVPPGLEPGAWDLGLVLLDADGRVLAPLPDAVPGPGTVVARGNDAVYAEGEVRFPGLVGVGTLEEVHATMEDTRAQALASAEAGGCEDAEGSLVTAKRTVPRDQQRQAALRKALAGPIAACWARRAEAEPDAAPALLARAHGWDHHDATLTRVGAPVGEALWASGLEARARGDAESAYRDFTALLSFQPWRSWARRYAEEARDLRLGITRGRN
jgi:hypothetical protein